VADEHDRRALVAQVAQDREEVPGLALGDRGGRLVEQEDLAALGERLRDLEQLGLARAQPACLEERVEVEPDLVQPRSCLGDDTPVADEPARSRHPAEDFDT
jgi:hypothetical protein